MSVLEVTVESGVGIVTMNRPEKRNAINPEMMVRLAEAWAFCRAEAAVRVVVLTGAGDLAFSAGGDLRSLIPLLTRARPATDEWDSRLLADQRGVVNAAMLRGPAYPKPVIAAVNGACVAGGMELMLACDLRVAADHVSFALSEVQLGLIPGGGSVARLPRQVATAIALELLMTGEPISVRRAHEVGLVNHVTPRGQELERALGLARRIAANAPLAVQAVKRVGLASPGLPLEEAFALEDAAVRQVMRSHDAREGAQAFAEGRDPAFNGE